MPRSLGYASYYCPLTPSDGLHFSYDTEVVQLHSSDAARADVRRVAGPKPSIGPTINTWIQAGSWPACLLVLPSARAKLRRERLAVHRDADGTVKVVNGLGVADRFLVLRR